MDAFVKSFATYRTIKKAAVIASALTVDSLEKDNSTVTVKGTDIGRSDTGNWLICDGQVFRIAQVKPQNDRTLLTLSDGGSVSLQVASTNTRAIRLYERLGFVTVGETEKWHQIF